MKAIWKYQLKVTDRVQSLVVPLGATLLSVVEQYDEPVAYFMVDPEQTITESFWYAVWGTGHRHDESEAEMLKYHSTVVTHGGRLVWHVFV